MNFYIKFPTQILALLNPGTPNNGGGFLDALKGPLLILAVALGCSMLGFVRRHRRFPRAFEPTCH